MSEAKPHRRSSRATRVARATLSVIAAILAGWLLGWLTRDATIPLVDSEALDKVIFCEPGEWYGATQESLNQVAVTLEEISRVSLKATVASETPRTTVLSPLLTLNRAALGKLLEVRMAQNMLLGQAIVPSERFNQEKLDGVRRCLEPPS